MNILESALSKVQFFFSSTSKSSSNNTPPKDTIQHSFPRFSELPLELRDYIWKLAAQQRIIPLHLSQYTHREYKISEWLAENSLSFSEANTEEPVLERLRHEAEGVGSIFYFYTMSILICDEGNCECSYLPPSSPHFIPPPATFLACRESYVATRPFYKSYLRDEYTTRGLPFKGEFGLKLARNAQRPPSLRGEKTPRQDDSSYRTGVFASPAHDVLMVKMNIASSSSVQEIHQLIAVLSKEMPNLKKFAVRATISMPPYKWWTKERFQYWKTIGVNTNWVSKKVVCFGKLEELVLILDKRIYGEKAKNGKMLPEEWRIRTAEIWKTELEGMREFWPENWNGEMPRFRIATGLEDV
ncbi:hypothetical protein B0O99DRAFT_738019 [Bisporella sp. PMI_857]|nr:hypothetical protein B0O99DRAFT_738019 [Bisporella sp. PMI_857]